jgi:hypothetical protein
MRKILVAALVISLVANIYLLAKFFDAGIMVDNSRSEAKRQRERSEVSLALVNRAWIGKRSDEIADVSKELGDKFGLILGTEGDAIEVGDLVFETKDGVITEVHYID